MSRKKQGHKAAKFRLSPLAKDTCADCPLSSHFAVHKQVTTEYYPLPGVKPPRVDVMFVAEAPGASENNQGRPFIGLSGRVLRRTVMRLCDNQQVGFAYGNVVRCRPTRPPGDDESGPQNRTPTQREIKMCRGSILRDIERLQPKAIVLLGDSAAKGIARNRDGSTIDPKTKVNLMRGHHYVVPLPSGKTIPAVVTYHFAHVYRHPKVASVFREDVGKVIRRVRGQLDDFSHRGDETVMLDTIPKVKKFLGHLVKKLTKDDVVAFDYETEGVTRRNNPVLCCSFSFSENKSFVLPLKHKESPWGGAAYKEVMKLLRKFLRVRNPSFRALVPHNLKFEDLVTIDQFGTHILLPMEDTFQRAHSLNEDRKGAVQAPYGLKPLAEEQLAFYHYQDDDIARMVKLRNEGRLAEAPLHDLAQYNGMDAYVTWRLWWWQNRWAEAEGYLDRFQRISHELHGPVGQFLAEMEKNGLLADKRRVEELMSDDSEIKVRLAAIEEELFALDSVKEANRQLLVVKNLGGGGGFWGDGRDDVWIYKIQSTEAKRILFFNVLGLEAVKRSRKTNQPSAGKELFDKYEGVKEIDLYAEYSALQKVMSTYVKSISKFLHDDPDMRDDNRVRPNFRPTGTITGRISSANPNMLNIPARRKDAASKAIKRLYIVPPGYCLVCADYSQAEVRWLAEATKDQFLVKAFRDAYEAKRLCRLDPTPENRRRSALEGDFHRHTAAMINKVELADVTKTQRSASKAIVFGLVYGMSIHGLAGRLGVTKQQAAEFIDVFFAQFPTAKKWLDQMEREGFRNGFVYSPTGRRKLVNSWLLLGNTDPRNAFKKIRSFYNHEMRVCRNAPIQGVASDTNLLACSQLLQHILQHQLDWKIINTVYDSIMIEVPFPDAQECIETAQTIMEDPRLFAPFGLQPQVPFAADFSVGVNWGDQFEIAYDSEAWDVQCQKCGAVRSEKQRPTNQRCEECGSRRVRRSITEGPMDLLLRQIDRDHGLSELWG